MKNRKSLSLSLSSDDEHIYCHDRWELLNINKNINNKDLKYFNVLDLLSNYKIIGSGTFGNVYRHNDVAIKTSNILEYVSELYHTINNPEVDALINEYHNESKQIMTFSELSNNHPNNYLKIYDIINVLSPHNEFPYNIIFMNYINGINLHKFIQEIIQSDYEILFKMIIKIISLIFDANIGGFFHNDISLNNIIIDHNLNPVFIDYSFSKKIIKKNKYPVECNIFIDILNMTLLDDFKQLPKYVSLYNFLSQLMNKYNITLTPFVEKILSGKGIFQLSDYFSLPELSLGDMDLFCHLIDTAILL